MTVQIKVSPSPTAGLFWAIDHQHRDLEPSIANIGALSVPLQSSQWPDLGRSESVGAVFRSDQMIIGRLVLRDVGQVVKCEVRPGWVQCGRQLLGLGHRRKS